MPLWLTVSGRVAIVAVCCSDAALLLGGIVTVTDPLPVPLVGLAPRPLAVQPHDGPDAVTVMFAVPPAAGTFRTVGLIANEQSDPNWRIVCAWPATMILSGRGVVPVFAATL